MAKSPAQQAAIAISMKKAGKKPKEMKKGGKMKFNPKYTRGSSNVEKRKKLLTLESHFLSFLSHASLSS